MTVLVDVRALSVRNARRHVALSAWCRSSIPSSQEWEGTAPPMNEAAKRGCDAIDLLSLADEISPAVAARGKELIKFLFKPNTVYAAISPDDDGLSFYWAAQEMSLTIIMYADDYWWSVRNESACDSYSGGGPNLPLIELQHSLNQFSKAVAQRNPEWRSLIR